MLSDLAEEGVSRTSLLVIPDHHHKGCIDADPAFSAWLRVAVDQGHEAVLHGYYHLRSSKDHEGFATRLITRSYTAGEGEFYDLDFKEASTLLRAGREALERCGVKTEGLRTTPVGFNDLKPDGFVAPAWLLGEEAERAVKAEGFRYTTRISTIIDFRSGTTHSARSMVYSVRAGWRRVMSLFWNEMLFHALRNKPLLRIGLHPPDWEHEAIRRHILKCVRLALAQREVTTYREWLDQITSSVH